MKINDAFAGHIHVFATMYLQHVDSQDDMSGVFYEQTFADSGASNETIGKFNNRWRISGACKQPPRNMSFSAGSGKFSQTGFTLVEMLLVLAIIGLSAALVVPAVHTVVTRYQRQVASAEEVEERRMDALRDFARDLPLHDSVLYPQRKVENADVDGYL